MASADYGKQKTAQEVKAKIAHDDKEKRKEQEHTNKHINKALTENNLTYFDDTNYGYEEVCQRYDEIINYLDSQPKANKRKDRVTCVSIVIPVPEGMKPEDEDRFFIRCGEVLCEQYGEENLLQGYFHKDEKHDYYDPVEKRMRTSCNHGTFRFVPVVDGKLNAREFTKRANIIKNNNALHEMCLTEFGVPFNNGKGKRGQTVEQLKAETSKIIELQDLNKKSDELDKRALLLDRKEIDLNLREKILDKQADSLKEREIALKSDLSDLDKAKRVFHAKVLENDSEVSRRVEEGIKKGLEERRKRERQAEALSGNITPLKHPRRGYEFD